MHATWFHAQQLAVRSIGLHASSILQEVEKETSTVWMSFTRLDTKGQLPLSAYFVLAWGRKSIKLVLG